jgi:hypothetical protein
MALTSGTKFGPYEIRSPLGALAHTHVLGYSALATSLFFRKERLDFRVAAERSIALNPMDGSTVAFMGLLMAATGD